jgi:ribose transport system permease protein
LLGVAVLIVVGNLVILLGLPIDVQLIIKGVIIISAAAVYRTKLV